MRRIALAGLCLLLAGAVFAGGIVTNNNQSTQYIRTMSRNASTDMDAAYYNPAGIALMDEGFAIGLSNQTIFQNREVTSDVYPHFNGSDTFEGSVSALIFPNLFLAYKTGNLGLSLAFAPVGGGGSATYDDGLPSFEMMFAGYIGAPAAVFDPALAPFGNITGFSEYFASFEGSSMYLGTQANISYAVNEMLAVGLGVRYLMATNVYDGAIDVTYAADGGLGDLPPMEFRVDAEQSGTAYTPIVSAHLTPMDGLAISFRYEHLTALELENTPGDDDNMGMFPDSVTVHADMPAMVSCGISYDLMEKLAASLSVNYYLNTGVDWDWPDGEAAEDYLDNGFEVGVGFEYALTEDMTASLGYLFGDMGAKQEYQNDLSYTMDFSSFGFGGKYAINDQMTVDLGGFYTMYTETADALDMVKYNKSAYGGAIGFSYYH